MTRLRRVLRRPQGQVLLATLLFCFVFTLLFAGLYRSGLLYRAKTRVTRSADLTCLSGGAVYANGLQLTRYANVVLTTAIVVDIVKMAVAITASGGAAAGLATRFNTRKRIQELCDLLLGVEKQPGIYPYILIPFETNAIARDNGFKPSEADSSWNALPVPPILLYNIQTNQGLQCLKPTLGLRFRTGKDLLKALEKVVEVEPKYLTHDRKTGAAVTLTSGMVEPCRNSQHSNQMCVKTWITRYSGQYCSELNEGINDSPSGGPGLLKYLGKAKWALKGLEKILEQLKLDITDKSDPPDHSLTLYGPARSDQFLIHQTSAVRLEGKGLAAWDLLRPPFKVRLVPVPFEQFPLVRQAVQAVPSDWSGDFKQGSAFISGGAP